MNIDETILSKLSDEMKKKVEAAKTPEELLALARESGYELTPDQLESISGGDRWYKCISVCDAHSKCVHDPHKH